METQPPNLPPPSPPETKKSAWALWGAIVGAISSTLILLLRHYGEPANEGLGILSAIANLAALLVTPLVALALTFPKRTRSFGLGLLLAVGVCWLVELAICGGAAAFS